MRSVLFAAALAASFFLRADKAPMEWVSVHTNAIVQWKASHNAAAGVVADKVARTVTILAEATGVAADECVEFFAIGPLSDRAYESFAVTVASPDAIAAAVEAIGVPRGVPVDAGLSCLWPQGEGLSLTVTPVGRKALSLNEVMIDAQEKEEGAVLTRPVLWTGGARDASGGVVAATNIPCAVFALYNQGASLLQLDGLFDQSSTYGRFRAKRAFAPGDLLEITLAWDGVRRVVTRTLEVGSKTDLAALVKSLQKDAERATVFAKLALTPDVTVAQAENVAKVFEFLDGRGVKMSGEAPGQFFYRAFLPDPAWRQRAGRMFQPFEIHVTAEGKRTFVFIEEDWSGEGMDPVLKPHETPFKDWNAVPALIAKTGEQGAKVNVVLVYAPASAPVSSLAPVIAALRPRIATFYVLAEAAHAKPGVK